MNIYLFGLVLIVSIRFGQFVMVILYFPNIVDLHLNKTMYVSGNSKWLCATECTFTVRPYGRNTLVNIGNRLSPGHVNRVHTGSRQVTHACTRRGCKAGEHKQTPGGHFTEVKSS